jgi:excisionase family DNA binding protein
MEAGMSSRTRFPDASDTEAAASGDVHQRRHRDDQIKFFTISEVAERLGVVTRTISRRIKSGDLVVHRFGGVVRVAESDLRAFLAAHREDEA